MAVSVDAQHAGVHIPVDLDPAIAARRLLAVNLSDLAAVGAVPRYAFLSLAAPKDYDQRRFLKSLIEHASKFGVELAGGDLSRLSAPSFTLTLIGTRAKRGRFLERRNAAPGSILWVGGTLGEAALGLRLVHRGARVRGRSVELPGGVVPRRLRKAAKAAVRRQLLPTPQIELGQWLARRRAAVAAIDLSDGLGRDLARLCAASHVGAQVSGRALPFAHQSEDLSQALGEDLLALATGGGEDYVLLFSLPASVRPPAHFGCATIGRLISERGVILKLDDQKVDISRLGWDHLE